MELPGRGSDLALGRFFSFLDFSIPFDSNSNSDSNSDSDSNSGLYIYLFLYMLLSLSICSSLSLSRGIRRQTIKHISTASRIYVSPSPNPI